MARHFYADCPVFPREPIPPSGAIVRLCKDCQLQKDDDGVLIIPAEDAPINAVLERQKHMDSLREREVKALEDIAFYLEDMRIMLSRK